MNERRNERYVLAYSEVRRIMKYELNFSSLRELYRHLEQVGDLQHGSIVQKFKIGEAAQDWFFKEIANFLASAAHKRKKSVTAEKYYDRITAPLRQAEVEAPAISAAAPDLPDRVGDGPNVTAKPNNLLEELVQADIMVTGGNYSALGRFLLAELSFHNPSIKVGDEYIELHLMRCLLKLSFDTAMAGRNEARQFQDQENPALRIKINAGEGIGRERSWEIAHLETADPLLGTFMIDPLCTIENELVPSDNAKLVAQSANVRVVRARDIVEDPEKQRVIDQLIKIRKLPIERDGSILFSFQKLRR
jgi:hypothetical protein